MRKWPLWIGLLAILLLGGYFILSYYGVKAIQAQLQKILGPGFSLKEVQIRWTHLALKGIEYEGLHTKKKYLEIEEMRIYPALSSLFARPFRIREVIIHRPSVSFYRTRDGVFVGPWASRERTKGKEPSGKKEREGGDPLLKIDRLRVQRGSVHFEDWRVGEPPATIGLADVDLEMKVIHYPFRSSRSPLELRGKLRGATGKEGVVFKKGWVDLETFDMETNLNLRGIEVKLFEPYYRKKVSAEIDSGSVGIEAKIHLKEKFIDIPGRLELSEFRIKEGGTVFWIPAKSLISLLREKGDRLEVPFRLRGSIGDPKFNLQEAFLTRIGSSLLEALGAPVRTLSERGKGLAEELKALEQILKKKKR